jgi:hypothetical protein
MNYYSFTTIDMNGGLETFWYRFCFLNNKRRLNPSRGIEWNTKTANEYLILNGKIDEKFPD